MKPMKANEDKSYITIYWYRIYYSAYMSVLLTIMKLYYMNVGNSFELGDKLITRRVISVFCGYRRGS